MCEIIYEIKEYVYFLILYFYIEKRENGVLNVKLFVYVYCNIILSLGIIFIKEFIKLNCWDIVIYSNKMNSYVIMNYFFYIVVIFIL